MEAGFGKVVAGVGNSGLKVIVGVIVSEAHVIDVQGLQRGQRAGKREIDEVLLLVRRRGIQGDDRLEVDHGIVRREEQRLYEAHHVQGSGQRVGDTDEGVRIFDRHLVVRGSFFRVQHATGEGGVAAKKETHDRWRFGPEHHRRQRRCWFGSGEQKVEPATGANSSLLR